jgi:23S rRNA pseudouridine1911/1915/1917 synthase
MATFSVIPNKAVTYVVAYEDDDLMVVDKPARLVTQPGKGHEEDTLLNGLFARHGTKFQNLGAERDFGLLHRLDRDTSGLLVVAMRASAYDGLRKAFERREVRKFYWAAVANPPKGVTGVIRRTIAEYDGPGPNARKGAPARKLAKISNAGKEAVTAYRVLSSSPFGAMVECRPVTGRLHQVRVHLASIGSPIAGDEMYAPKEVAELAPRLALHAHRLCFKHPISGAVIDIRSGWPGDLRNVLKKLKLKKPMAEDASDDANAPGAGA